MHSRKRSRSRSPIQETPQFPLIVAVPKNLFNASQVNELQKTIVKCHKVDRVHYADEIPAEEFQDNILYIYGQSVKGKVDALSCLIAALQKAQEASTIEIKMLIPDSMVTLLVGRHGKQIQKIQYSSNTQISIKPEIRNFRERVVHIEGRPLNIEKAVKEIYKLIVEKRASPEPKAAPLEGGAAKFIIPGECVGYLIGKNGSFTKKLQEDYDVDFKVYPGIGQPCKDEEHIAVLSGRHKDCRYAIRKAVVKKILDAVEATGCPSTAQLIRMLIPSNIVKELIGPSGTTIKNISSKSGGATIRVLSDTESEKLNPYTIVTIDGPLEVKENAAMNIFEILDKPTTSSPPRKHYSKSPEPEPISFFATVPDSLVAKLIGRNGDNVKSMMNKAKCKISFQKSATQSLKTPEGESARLCYFKGTPDNLSAGVKILLENIQKHEHS